MSYGWLTESSCIPKPGKEILSVSKQSIISLKALLVEEEADKLKRKHTKTNARSSNRNKKLPITHQFEKKKRLTNESRTKDKAFDATASQDAPFCYDALEKKLEKKAEIYDSLVSGKLEIKDVANILDPSQKSKSKQSQDTDQLCLDFEKKHQCHETFQDDRRHFCKDEKIFNHTKDGTVEKEASQLLQQLRDRLEKLSSEKRTE